MPTFTYVAMDSRGKETKGTLDVANQNEAIGRLKEMGYFPTKVVEVDKAKEKTAGKDKKDKAAKDKGKPAAPGAKKKRGSFEINIPGLGGKVKPKVLTTFTRQLATLVDAGLPLLRGLRVLERQEKNATLRRIINELAASIEGGSTFSEGLAQHPKVFNRLYINMVKAGEMGGVLEVVLNRLAEFMEKAEKIKGKVIAAMFYPAAVMCVAGGILLLLMTVVVPKFKQIFADMLEGQALPGFTQVVLSISDAVKDYTIVFPAFLGGFPAPGPVVWILVALYIVFKLVTKTRKGRWLWDKVKLMFPGLGPVITKVAISRFTRTLGTLISSGVPILQALTIVKETAGNLVISEAVGAVHESVKEGETITAPLDASKVFPPHRRQHGGRRRTNRRFAGNAPEGRRQLRRRSR